MLLHRIAQRVHGGFSVKQILHYLSLPLFITTVIANPRNVLRTGKAVEEFVHLGTFESLTEALPTIHCDKNYDCSGILEACRTKKYSYRRRGVEYLPDGDALPSLVSALAWMFLYIFPLPFVHFGPMLLSRR